MKTPKASILAACLLLILPAAAPTLAGSVTITGVGGGGGQFRGDPNDPGEFLSGKVRVTIIIEDTGSPASTLVGIEAQLTNFPQGRLYIHGDGRFDVQPGFIVINVDNNDVGRAGQAVATLYSALIQPGVGFPNLFGASGDFGLGNDLSTMGGTLGVVPEPASVLLLPLGMVGAWLRWRRRAA